LNKRASGYVFLNKKVKNQFFFIGMNKAEFVFRSMGFDMSLVSAAKPCSNSIVHDMVYMGSLKRSGLVEMLHKVARLGYRIAVIGNSDYEADLFKENDNIECFGRLTQQESFSIAKRCKFGLNYTPDEYPFYFQDSTKLIEYCGLGLKVITNRYEWVDQFEFSSDSAFMDLSELLAGENPNDFNFKIGDVSHLSWINVIDKSGLEQLISYSLAS
jgi:hypothetical protein